jgi:prevent-host-death family protein
METASISEVKNGLSAIIDRVKGGESIVVTDRGIPVAVIEPVSGRIDVEDRLARLERAGAVRRGSGPVPAELLRTVGPTPSGGASVVQALLEERRASR